MPLDKRPSNRVGTVAVTFRVPLDAGAASAVLLGEFTDWAAVPMTPTDDGGHEVTIELPRRLVPVPVPPRRCALGQRLGRRRLRGQSLRQRRFAGCRGAGRRRRGAGEAHVGEAHDGEARRGPGTPRPR